TFSPQIQYPNVISTSLWHFTLFKLAYWLADFFSTHMKPGTTATFNKGKVKKFGSITTHKVHRQNNCLTLNKFSKQIRHASIISTSLWHFTLYKLA
ncbi:hypothetical protein P3465_23680, partial [Vibrio parahaemolyticus]|nr:hypothetical protein [Vibrio parahaemolyticus]